MAPEAEAAFHQVEYRELLFGVLLCEVNWLGEINHGDGVCRADSGTGTAPNAHGLIHCPGQFHLS